MKPLVRMLPAAIPILFLAACARPTPPTAQAASPGAVDAPRGEREVRVTGIVEAVHSSKVLEPDQAHFSTVLEPAQRRSP